MKELAVGLNAEEKEKINKAVALWTRRFSHDVRGRVPKDSGQGKGSIKQQAKKTFGLVEMTGVRFNRYLVFVEMGVFGGLKRAEAQKAGHQPKPWFNPIVEKRLPELTQMVGKELGPISINAARFRIKNTETTGMKVVMTEE